MENEESSQSRTSGDLNIKWRTSPDDPFFFERLKLKSEMWAYLLEERYGLDGLTLRQRIREEIGGNLQAPSYHRDIANALFQEIEEIIGTIPEYIADAKRRKESGLLNRYEEWKNSLESRGDKVG